MTTLTFCSVLLMAASVIAFSPQPWHIHPHTSISKIEPITSTSTPLWRRRTMELEPVVIEEENRVTSSSPEEDIVRTEERQQQFMEEITLPAEVTNEESMSETQRLMAQVKDAGLAGVISYALWEFAFWAFSVPVVVFGYREVAGHWPDLTNSDDLGKLGAEA
jgi:hypothetical protein